MRTTFVAHRLFWRCDKVVCIDKPLYHYRLAQRAASAVRTYARGVRRRGRSGGPLSLLC